MHRRRLTRIGEWNRVIPGYTLPMASSPFPFRVYAIGEVITECQGTGMEAVKTTDGVGYRKCAGCSACERQPLPPIEITPTAPARAMEALRLAGGLGYDDDPM